MIAPCRDTLRTFTYKLRRTSSQDSDAPKNDGIGSTAQEMVSSRGPAFQMEATQTCGCADSCGAQPASQSSTVDAAVIHEGSAPVLGRARAHEEPPLC